MFTSLQVDNAQRLNDCLSEQGFRRSQHVLYRPSCTDCAACMSARIKVNEFRISTSQRRIAKKNAALTRSVTSPWATEEQYDLFRKYLSARHNDGGMADMDVFEFAAMIEETPIRTRVIEYRDGGELIAACLTDILDDGLSLVYSFFNPDCSNQSIGTYVILDQIALAAEYELPYVYLGYWVPGSPKMGYKARFSGLELFRGQSWQSYDPKQNFDTALHPLNSTPIAEQVANLSLPEKDLRTD